MSVEAVPYHVTAPDAASPLRQGEILTDLGQFQLDAATIGANAVQGDTVRHPFVVVLTQDCDLEQDHRVRFPVAQDSDKLIPSVLFCDMIPAEELFGPIIAKLGKKSRAWDRIRQNNDSRYHYLQKVEARCDRLHEELPELAIDFKHYFTLPTEEVYRRIELGEVKRRCALVSPYLEHLSSRFASYLSRVALLEPHFSD